MFIKKLGCVCIALVIQACATPPKYTPITQQNRDSIKTLDVYNLVMQDEVRPSVDVTNVTGAMGGGLLSAAIDASVNDDRSNESRSLTEEFYIVTEDIDYRALQAQAVNSALETLKPTNPKSSAEVMVMADGEIKTRVAALKAGEGFLFLTSHYLFVDNFKVLQTGTAAYFYVGSGGKVDYTKATYKNDFIYQSPTVGDGGAASIKLWSADKGKLFREQLKNSLDTLREKMIYDMQPISNETCINTTTFAFPTQVGVQTITGNTVKTAADTSLIRSEDGALYTVSTVKLSPAKKNTCGVTKNAK